MYLHKTRTKKQTVALSVCNVFVCVCVCPQGSVQIKSAKPRWDANSKLNTDTPVGKQVGCPCFGMKRIILTGNFAKKLSCVFAVFDGYINYEAFDEISWKALAKYLAKQNKREKCG